ncbi:hypothetical protein AB1Y20_002473 [Prymnesium parvum]|uniref:Uncharacterized protein n=1 Tax=Prymnesium parvum TaxID=97485 RepID=A0AB34J821_PRYPA
MLFALSDLLLAGTLLVNAGAVINYKLPMPLASDSSESTKDRCIELIRSIRVFRIPLALWNLFVILPLMVIWFP